MLQFVRGAYRTPELARAARWPRAATTTAGAAAAVATAMAVGVATAISPLGHVLLQTNEQAYEEAKALLQSALPPVPPTSPTAVAQHASSSQVPASAPRPPPPLPLERQLLGHQAPATPPQSLASEEYAKAEAVLQRCLGRSESVEHIDGEASGEGADGGGSSSSTSSSSSSTTTTTNTNTNNNSFVQTDEQAYEEAKALLQSALPPVPPAPTSVAAQHTSCPQVPASAPRPPLPLEQQLPATPPRSVDSEEYAKAEAVLQCCLGRSQSVENTDGQPSGGGSSHAAGTMQTTETHTSGWSRAAKISAALRQTYSEATSLLSQHLGGDETSSDSQSETPTKRKPPLDESAPSSHNDNTGPGGLLLHEDVINQIDDKMGGNGDLIARLVELARVCVIELGDGEFCLQCIDAAMAACPLHQQKELRELLWVEGLGCFYAGEWERGSKHFEAEMAINGSDVEVPVWRWLCDAHNPGIGVKAARDRLLPLQATTSTNGSSCSDPRGRPFDAIWSLYKGEGSIQAVLESAKAAGSADATMWGSFYVGLYLEALGQHRRAREQFERAAAADSHNNIAQLATTHLRMVRKAAARREWSDMQQPLSTTPATETTIESN